MSSTPFIRPDLTVTTVPSGIHNAGTGVEEYGYLVLGTRDITRIDELVASELIEWWAGEYRFRLDGDSVSQASKLQPVNGQQLLRTLLFTHVLPAAIITTADPAVADGLRSATEESEPGDIPGVDVLIDPIAIAVIVAHLFDGPIVTTQDLENAVRERSEDAELLPF